MIEIAACSGFCFGVNRAVDKVEFLLKHGFKVCTLGELIHNRPFCEQLRQKGVRVVKYLDGTFFEPGECLVIRSHGAGPSIYSYCREHGIKLVDATCPFVKRIHRIVKLKSDQGRKILIAGDENHPEVSAIKKYCSGFVFIFSNFDHLWPYLKNNCSSKFVLVSQTTFNSVAWKKGIEKLKNFGFFNLTNVEVFNTICHVTETRQVEVISLAKRTDFVVVVGGRNSSNTKKLFELCSIYCKTLFIEKVEEIELFLKTNRLPNDVGLCAGASTPIETIKKVYDIIKQRKG